MKPAHDRSPITTHILDVARGKPAAGVHVHLETQEGGGAWREIGKGITDADGRIETLLRPGSALAAGHYRLHFATDAYFKSQSVTTFYPSVTVTFETTQNREHYHVPLLLSPFGYSTYRGT